MLKTSLSVELVLPYWIDAIKEAFDAIELDISKIDILQLMIGENVVLNGGKIVSCSEIDEVYSRIQTVWDKTRTELTEDECFIGALAIDYLLRLHN